MALPDVKEVYIFVGRHQEEEEDEETQINRKDKGKGKASIYTETIDHDAGDDTDAVPLDQKVDQLRDENASEVLVDSTPVAPVRIKQEIVSPIPRAPRFANGIHGNEIEEEEEEERPASQASIASGAISSTSTHNATDAHGSDFSKS